MMFFDEAPDQEVPVIAVVVVEQARFNTINVLIGQQDATPLEVFIALAPAGTVVPARIQKDHDLRSSARSEPVATRQLVTPGDTEGPFIIEDLVVEDDDWGNGCEDAQGWVQGFNAWSNNSSYEKHHHYFEAWDGAIHFTFGSQDEIWAGVCLIGDGVAFSESFVQVQVRYQDKYGNWQYVGGTTSATQVLLHEGERYLYHNWTYCASNRRIELWTPAPLTLRVSGASRDDFCSTDYTSAPSQVPY